MDKGKRVLETPTTGRRSVRARVSGASASIPTISAGPSASTVVPAIVATTVAVTTGDAATSTVVTAGTSSAGLNMPVELTTVISPVGYPDFRAVVATPGITGNEGLTRHIRELRHALNSTFWHEQVRQLPSGVFDPPPPPEIQLQRGEMSGDWIPTVGQKRLLMEAYHRSGGLLPSWIQSRQLASILQQYGKITASNVYHWFRDYWTREKEVPIADTVRPSTIQLPPATLSLPRPAPVPLPLSPVTGGETSGNHQHPEGRTVAQDDDDDDEDLLRLELRPPGRN